MNFRKSRNLMWTGFAVGILLIAFGYGHENETVALALAVSGIIVTLAAVIQAFVFYICPHCGYSLMNVHGDVPEHCPKCGKSLKEEQEKPL